MVCLLIFFFLQYAESSHFASPLGPLLLLQQPQHRAMFQTFGCFTESSSICSQLARLLRLRAPILNLSLQYTQDLSLRATCLTTGSGMLYFVAFVRTRVGTPQLFVISSPSTKPVHEHLTAIPLIAGFVPCSPKFPQRKVNSCRCPR
jgi:hypothetical protein